MAVSYETVEEVIKTGLNATYKSANTDGHMFVNDGRSLVHVKNASGSAVTATIETGATRDGYAIADQEVSVPAGEDRFIGPFPPRTFNVQSGDDRGKVKLTFSAITSVTVAFLKI